MSAEWWKSPRTVSVVVDNDSWILPFAEKLVAECRNAGDTARLCRNHDEVQSGGVAFYLGCIKITPGEILRRNHRNLIVHESDLPRGRGFSPLTWQILEGAAVIPVCLLEAADEVDAGPVVFRESLQFEGHELIDEMRGALGRLTVSLCMRYLGESDIPTGVPQSGAPSSFGRRRPTDSRLDVNASILSQFNLLRVVDNERYPAFFEHLGHRYRLRIEKAGDE